MTEEFIRHWWAEHANGTLEWRRHLHAYLELSHMEYVTTAFVEERLRAVGLKPALFPNTDLMVDIGEDELVGSGVDGERLGRLAFRGDIDAFPITEVTGPGFAGTNDGVMHICGHDFHTAIALATALAMVEYHEKYTLSMPLRFIFQPAEEVMVGGVPEVIAADILNGVECIFAVHCEPKLRVGHVGVQTGVITSAVDTLEIQVHGPGGYTSRPQMTADVVYILGKLIVDLSDLLSRCVDPCTGTVFTFGSVHPGYVHNATPSEGNASGTLRTVDIKTWRDIDPLVRDLIEQALAPTDADCTINYERGVPPVLNDEYCTALTAEAVRRVDENAVIQAPQLSGGEGFGRYLEHVPGVMVRLGRWSDRGDKHDLHRDDLIMDERCPGVGAKLLAGIAARYEDGAQSTMTVR